MTYENNHCPVCGQIFSAEDDVVFCPDCGTPHHRECWKQNGACAFADKHAQGYVWQSTVQPEEPEQARQPEGMTCPRCGAECASNALVCPECGNRFGVIPGSYNYNDDYFLRGVEGDPDADLGISRGIPLDEVLEQDLLDDILGLCFHAAYYIKCSDQRIGRSSGYWPRTKRST